MNIPARCLILALTGCTVLMMLGCPSPAQSNRQYAQNLYKLGMQACQYDSQESAIIFFKRACDIDPDFADAQFQLGLLYQGQKS